MSLRLPFTPNKFEEAHEDLFQCGLYKLLPNEMQEACHQSVHLLEYLHVLPIEDMGIPDYYEKATRKLGELKDKNLVYRASDDILIHVWSGAGEERDIYIPVEPTFGIDVGGKLNQVESALIDLAHLFASCKTKEEKKKALISVIHMVCDITDAKAATSEAPIAAPMPDEDSEDGEEKGKGKKAKKAKAAAGGSIFGLFGSKNGVSKRVKLTQREFDAILYIILRDKVGMGALEPMIQDTWIEDISCSGVGPMFVEHKIFKGMRNAMSFETYEELDEFVLRLSEQIKKPVTLKNPIVDATLPDGSRINIVYSRNVSARGSNFTIRKFSDVPLSILELINFHSLDYKMAAYLSLMIGEGMNLFVSGETPSGKTTLMNAPTTFVPPEAKVVTIEDTPEVQVPHPNWIREVAKASPKAGEGAAVSMLDLLKAALRQRPNLIIIGEIRGEEGLIAFQAMQTGHPVMATFHAAEVEKLIQRLTGAPILVPKTYVENLNIIVIQSTVKLPDGRPVRRAITVSEIVGYDSVSDSFSFVEVFRWNPVTDAFDFVGDRNSYLLEEVIAPRKGLPPNKKTQIYSIVDKRARVLEKLNDKGLTGYYELLRILAKAQKEGLF